jgi:hypothetical protein
MSGVKNVGLGFRAQPRAQGFYNFYLYTILLIGYDMTHKMGEAPSRFRRFEKKHSQFVEILNLKEGYAKSFGICTYEHGETAIRNRFRVCTYKTVPPQLPLSSALTKKRGEGYPYG